MKVLLTFCLWFCILTCFGQTCSLKIAGKVTDIHTQEAISNAKIKIVGTNTQVLSDKNGDFILVDLCPGEYVLECILHSGCAPLFLTQVLPTTDSIFFKGEMHSVEIEDVLVAHYILRRDAELRYQLKTNDLSQLKGGTLGEQLSVLPGVTTLNTGASIVKPVVNGLHSNRLVTINNGIRQEGQQWGSEHAPEIDPNLADKMEVVQGASGLKYGPEAIGGAIIISPAALKYGEAVSGIVRSSVNTNGRGGMVSALLDGSFLKSKKLSFRMNGTGRIGGTLNSPNYFIKNTAMNEYSFSGALGYSMKKVEINAFYSRFSTNLGIFTGSHIGNLTDLNAAFLATEPKDSGFFTYQVKNPKQFIQHQLTKVAATVTWTPNLQTQFTYGYQYNLRQEYDLHNGYNDSIEVGEAPAFELNLWTNTLDIHNTLKHSKKWKSEFGISLLEQKNAYAGRFFIPNFKKIQGGVYYFGSYAWNDQWQIEYGIRFDISRLSVFTFIDDTLQNPINLFQNPSGSIGVSRLLGHHWIATLNTGMAWRPPSINELFSDGLHHGAAAIEVGDAQLKKEVALTTTTSLQYNSNLGSLVLQGFYTYFNGYINLQPSMPPVLTIVGAFPVFNYVQSTVYMTGINGIARIPIGKKWNYTLQGNFLLAQDISQREPVYGIPSNRLTNRIRFQSKFNKTKLNTFFVEVEYVNVGRQNRFVENADYVNPPSNYSLLNIQGGINFQTNSEKSPVQLVVACSNLTNETYRDYMNRFRYFTDELGRNWSLKCLIPINFNTKNKI